MKGVGGGAASPGDYVYFKSVVPLHKISIGSKLWRYYDFGPKVVPPLVCIPGIAGTADVYYKQIMSLCMKGYRVISIDVPQVWNHHEWIHSFEKFLDSMNIHHVILYCPRMQVHIYGTSLGGFLAQIFAEHRPRRVKSLVLSNTFLETHKFAAAMPWSPVVNWTPSFLLKRYLLTGIRDGPHEPFIADSVDFVVGQVETLSRDDLSSRLMLNVNVASVGSLMLPDSLITIMDTNDYSAVPQQLKEQLNERYPGARRAVLKTGGDFPFLSRPDEVNLYLQLHLRRVGVEPRSDLVQGFTRNGSAGSSKDQKDGGDSFDNSGGDNGHHGSGGSDHDRRHCASESHHSDEPIPTSTMLANTVLELVM
ncbi:Maspardin [Zea mays]|uniref:Maspardin n=2 Tax=Zea mays TaxID=4577 RepID=A0A317Y9E3_MAIZE|nr:Maspardin [Zea mays]